MDKSLVERYMAACWPRSFFVQLMLLLWTGFIWAWAAMLMAQHDSEIQTATGGRIGSLSVEEVTMYHHNDLFRLAVWWFVPAFVLSLVAIFTIRVRRA